MVTITRETSYRCSDDCVMSGCPGHVGTIEYQSTGDAYGFVMNGRELEFERGELEAMLSLLRALNRVDSVQPRGPAMRWQPIETCPSASRVVMFCDERNNIWTDGAWDKSAACTGFPPTHWCELPAPPERDNE